MGFFSSIFRSLRKSRKLAKLQRIISPPSLSLDSIHSDFLKELSNPKIGLAREQAMEEFLDLCEADPLVALTMKAYEADRETLCKIYETLVANGAGQWVKGHFAALSAIAYSAPLKFCLETMKDDEDMAEMAYKIINYFKQGNITNV